MASLFADLSAGWPAAFAGALLSLLFGYVWLLMLVKGTKCGIFCTVPLAFMALIGVTGALMGSAGALKTPTGMTKEEAEAVVASGGAVLCIIGALVVLVVGVALVVSACRRRSGKHFATDMAGTCMCASSAAARVLPLGWRLTGGYLVVRRRAQGSLLAY